MMLLEGCGFGYGLTVSCFLLTASNHGRLVIEVVPNGFRFLAGFGPMAGFILIAGRGLLMRLLYCNMSLLSTTLRYIPAYTTNSISALLALLSH